MAQHFLLSAGARSPSAAKIMRMSDDGVADMFLRLCWPETDDKPVCPDCGLDVQYKAAFVLAHKLREAMASSIKGLRIGGKGRVAEIDGAYFGGHVRPESRRAGRQEVHAPLRLQNVRVSRRACGQ